MALIRLNNQSISSVTALPSAVAVSNTPAFSMYATATTSLNANAVTKIALGGSYIDTDSGVDTSNSKYTVPTGKGGVYIIGGDIGTAGNVIDLHIGLYVNGSHSYDSLNWWRDYGDSTTGHSRSAIIDLSAGDYLELYCLVGTTTTTTTATDRTRLWGFKLI